MSDEPKSGDGGAWGTHGDTAQPETRSRQGWEYRAVEISDHKAFDGDANALGAEGWELVHIGDVKVAGVMLGFFKRPGALAEINTREGASNAGSTPAR